MDKRYPDWQDTGKTSAARSQLRRLIHNHAVISTCWCPFVVPLVEMDRWLVAGRLVLAGALHAIARRRRAWTPAIPDLTARTRTYAEDSQVNASEA
jgi:hypothetical protein